MIVPMLVPPSVLVRPSSVVTDTGAGGEQG